VALSGMTWSSLHGMMFCQFFGWSVLHGIAFLSVFHFKWTGLQWHEVGTKFHQKPSLFRVIQGYAKIRIIMISIMRSCSKRRLWISRRHICRYRLCRNNYYCRRYLQSSIVIYVAYRRMFRVLASDFRNCVTNSENFSSLTWRQQKYWTSYVFTCMYETIVNYWTEILTE
jgi:hypothetical protein